MILLTLEGQFIVIKKHTINNEVSGFFMTVTQPPWDTPNGARHPHRG